MESDCACEENTIGRFSPPAQNAMGSLSHPKENAVRIMQIRWRDFSHPTENAMRSIFPPTGNIMERFFLLDENAVARRRDSPLQGNAMYRGSPPKENTKGWERSAFSSRLGERGRRKTFFFPLLRESERESALSLWGLRERESLSLS